MIVRPCLVITNQVQNVQGTAKAMSLAEASEARKVRLLALRRRKAGEDLYVFKLVLGSLPLLLVEYEPQRQTSH